MRGPREHAFHYVEVKSQIQFTFSVEHSLFNRGKAVRTLMTWRVHIICFLLDAYMTTPGKKSPVKKTKNSSKKTESELKILLPKILREKKKKKTDICF